MMKNGISRFLSLLIAFSLVANSASATAFPGSDIHAILSYQRSNKHLTAIFTAQALAPAPESAHNAAGVFLRLRQAVGRYWRNSQNSLSTGTNPLQVTSGIRNYSDNILETPDILYEGTFEEVAARLRDEGKSAQANNLEKAYKAGMDRYPAMVGVPMPIRITRGGRSIAAHEGAMLIIDHRLLDHFQLLRQELVSEEFGHALFRVLLRDVGQGAVPTTEQHASEELHSDIKKLEDFLNISKLEDQAALLEPLIVLDLDADQFHFLLLQILSKERADKIIDYLHDKDVINDNQVRALKNLDRLPNTFDLQNQRFEHEVQIIERLRHLYVTCKTYPGLTAYFTEHDTTDLRETLHRYRETFNELLAQYHRLHPVPLRRSYFNMGGVLIQLGRFEDRLPGITHEFSADRRNLIFRRNGHELHLRRADADDGSFLVIGNRTYKLKNPKEGFVDLYDLVYRDAVQNAFGNAELLSFFGLTPEDVWETEENQTPENSGVSLYTYDYLKDPISPIAEPAKVPDPMPSEQLQEARDYFGSHRYDPNAPKEDQWIRLHYLTILSQSRYRKDEISAAQAMSDRILFTDELETMALDCKAADVRALVDEAMWGVSLLAVRHKGHNSPEFALNLSPDEIVQIKEQKPFQINSGETSEEEFKRLQSTFLAATQAGTIRPSYFIINIQNFSPSTYLSYMMFLREEILPKYGDQLTILLSVQETKRAVNPHTGGIFTPFDHDRPGTFTARRRVIETFGDDFYLTEQIANISDGGEGTRLANEAVRFEQKSRMLTSTGRTFLEENILTAGVLWLMLPEFGKGIRLWIASDSKIQLGVVNIGGHPLSELPSDFEIAGAGTPATVMTVEQRRVVQRLIAQIMRKQSGLSKTAAWDKAMELLPRHIKRAIDNNISARQLNKRGIFVTNARGRMEEFLEKEQQNLVIIKLAYDHSKDGGPAEVIENIFLLVEKAGVSLGSIRDFSSTPVTSDTSPVFSSARRGLARFLAAIPVSVFQSLFQGFLRNESTWDLCIFGARVNGIYGISYGAGAKAYDIGDHRSYFDMWQQTPVTPVARTELRAVEGNHGGFVTIEYEGDAAPIGDDVKFYGVGTVRVGDGVVMRNSRILVRGYLRIRGRTLIIDSTLFGKVHFRGDGAAIVGIEFKPGYLFEASRPSEPIEELEINGDETVTSIQYPSRISEGEHYLVRTITSYPYKDEAIVRLISGAPRDKLISRWDEIQGVLRTDASWEDVWSRPLNTVVTSDQWTKLLRLVVGEKLAPEVSIPTAQAILSIWKEPGSWSNKEEELNYKKQKIVDVFQRIRSARLTVDNISALEYDCEREIVNFLVQNHIDFDGLLARIQTVHDLRFNEPVSWALKCPKAQFNAVKNLLFAQALFEVASVLHPEILGVEGAQWEDIVKADENRIRLETDREAVIMAANENAPAEESSQSKQDRLARARRAVEARYFKEFIQLPHYGGGRTMRDARASIDSLVMQRRTTALRSPPQYNTIFGNRGFWSYVTFYSGAKVVYGYATYATARFLGYVNPEIAITRTDEHVSHPLFRTPGGWAHRAQDIAVALSGPVAVGLVSILSLYVGLLLVPIHDITHLAGLIPVTAIVTAYGAMAAMAFQFHPDSRLGAVLEHLGYQWTERARAQALVSEAS